MKIEFNNVTAKLIPKNKHEVDVVRAVKAQMTVEAPGIKYIEAHKLYLRTKGKHGWNGKVNVMSVGGEFPTGLLPEVQKFLWQIAQVVPTLVDNRAFPQPVPKLNATPLEMRDYQQAAIEACIQSSWNGVPWHRGILEIATGGGKTEIAVELFRRNPRPSMFIVHRKTLAKQTVERFEKYLKSPVGFMFDGGYQPHPMGITVATIQTIARSIDRAETQHLLDVTEQVFFDEAHLIAAKMAAGNQFIGISNRLHNAYFRWGLTATPFLRDVYSNYLLAGVTGDVLYAETSADLIKAGYLTPAKIIIDKASPINKCPNKWPDCYDTGIVLNKGRNDQIREWFKSVPKPCFVLTTQVAHAKILIRTLNGLSVEMLDGSCSNAERSRVIADLKSGALEGVVCTTIFDEGIDVPDLQSVILAGGGKSAIKTIQRVGRALRLSDRKKEATIVDFMDSSARTLKKHSEARIKTYQERGFKVVQN